MLSSFLIICNLKNSVTFRSVFAVSFCCNIFKFSSIRRMSDFNEKDITHYKEALKRAFHTPLLSSATLLPGMDSSQLAIHSRWSSGDTVRLEKMNFSRDFTISYPGLKVLASGLPSDTGYISAQAFNESGKRRVILREVKSPEEKVYLEIWNETGRETTFDMTDRKEHGKIITDAFGTFGSIKWSLSEEFLLYIAEAKQPKSVSFFKDVPPTTDESTKTVKGEEYVYREEWGEQLVGINHPVIVTLEIATGKIKVLNTEQLNVSAGQAIWGPEDKCIIFVGVEELPRKLGLFFCNNRRGAIYSIDFEEKIERISAEGDVFAWSPQFSPDFKTLIYLQDKVSGPHRMCSKLMKVDWEQKVISTVIDIVDYPKDGEFPGLFVDKLPHRGWTEGGKHTLMTTYWKSCEVIIAVNITTGEIQRIENVRSEGSGEDAGSGLFGSMAVLDVKNNIILASCSSSNIEPCLVAGKITSDNKIKVEWKIISTDGPNKVKRADFQYEVLTVKAPISEGESAPMDYEAIVLYDAKKDPKAPVIVVPHGGPHSVFNDAFDARFSFFVESGFNLCLVNFRGSLGYGEANVKSLLGKIGTNDVRDVQDAVELMKSKLNLGHKDIFVYGGSHGGFLGAHLIGQFPLFYKAAALGNPVIDLHYLMMCSDIPDWVSVECGIDFTFEGVGDHATVKKMWDMSPMQYVKNVQSPTLMVLGKKDQRVPCGQGIKYYHALKARNVPCSMYLYDDNHAIAKFPHMVDRQMHVALWFKKFMSPNAIED